MKRVYCLLIIAVLAAPTFGFDSVFLHGIFHTNQTNQDGPPTDTPEGPPLGSNEDDLTIHTPAPSAVLLCSLGVAVAARLRRRRSFC